MRSDENRRRAQAGPVQSRINEQTLAVSCQPRSSESFPQAGRCTFRPPSATISRRRLHTNPRRPLLRQKCFPNCDPPGKIHSVTTFTKCSSPGGYGVVEHRHSDTVRHPEQRRLVFGNPCRLGSITQKWAFQIQVTLSSPQTVFNQCRLLLDRYTSVALILLSSQHPANHHP